jgi:hypothetical protein
MSQTVAPTRTEQVFISGHAGLRVVRLQADTEKLAGGQQRVLNPGLRCEFENGAFRVTDAVRLEHQRFIEKYGDQFYPDGDNGEWASVEDFLRKRAAETGRFHELGYQAPDSGPTLQEIARLAAAGDQVALAELYETENAADARLDVLEAVTVALEALQARSEDQAQALAAAEAKGREEAEAAAKAAAEGNGGS